MDDLVLYFFSIWPPFALFFDCPPKQQVRMRQ